MCCDSYFPLEFSPKFCRRVMDHRGINGLGPMLLGPILTLLVPLSSPSLSPWGLRVRFNDTYNGTFYVVSGVK